MTGSTARDQPDATHLRPSFAPILLAWMGEKAGDAVGAFGGNLIPALGTPSVPGGVPPGGPSWLSALIERSLPRVEVVSRIHPLEPLFAPPDGLILPVWAIGRSADLPPEPLETVLRRVTPTSVDPDFPRRAVASIRRTLVSDPLATRLLSEESRVRAAGEESLLDPAESGTPPVVGLLPERFTLAQLRSVAAGLLGRSPEDLESGSNFRRRTRELVHRRVLVESESPARSDERERGGRPPRRYSFDAEAWRDWLLERCGGGSPDREPDALNDWELVQRAAKRRATEAPPEHWRDPIGGSVERLVVQDYLQRAPSLPRHATPSWSPDAHKPTATGSTDLRIARMAKLLEEMFRQMRDWDQSR